MVTLRAEQIGDAGEHPGLPMVVAERLRERLGLVEALARARKVAGRIQHAGRAEVELVGELLRGPIRRQPARRGESLLVAEDGLAAACLREPGVAGSLKERGRPLPGLAIAVVSAEGERVRGEVARMKALDRLPDPAVQALAHGGQEPVERHLADPVVGELQLLPHALQDAVADQLLDALGGLALGGVRGAAEERQVEPPADHRGHRDEPPRRSRPGCRVDARRRRARARGAADRRSGRGRRPRPGRASSRPP